MAKQKDMDKTVEETKRAVIHGIASGMTYDETCNALRIARMTLDVWLDEDNRFRSQAIRAIEIGCRARRRLIRDETGLVYPYKPAGCTRKVYSCGHCGAHPCIYTETGLTPESADTPGINLAGLQSLALEYLRVGAKPLVMCGYAGISLFQLSAWRKFDDAFAKDFLEAIGLGAQYDQENAAKRVRMLRARMAKGGANGLE